MRGKSRTGGKVEVYIDGKRNRSRSMKGVEASSKSDEIIATDLFCPQKEEMVIMQKSEGGKVRPVVKTGNSLNRMDFLSEYFEGGLAGNKFSSLFAGAHGNEEIDLRLIELTANRGWFKVPLDQSSFDQHQSKLTIAAVLLAMLSVMTRWGAPPEYFRVFEAMMDSLFVSGADVIIDGKVLGPWRNGVPSGWRWTALLDTLLNYASFRVIKISQARVGRRFNTTGEVFQGDDVAFCCDSLDAIQVILDTYGRMGYKVHPEKTFISRGRCEFLRRSFEAWGVTGYTSRTLLGFRFRTPVLAPPLCRGERLYSRMCQWHICCLRGSDYDRVAECLIEDAHQLGIASDIASDYLLTPNSVGGGGVSGSSNFGRALLRWGKGRWLVLKVEKEVRRIKPNLGQWERRLRSRGITLRGDALEMFERTLAAAWGIRESRMYGAIKAVFLEIPKVVGKELGSEGFVPKVDFLWDDEHIPTMVRGIWERVLVERGCWDELVAGGRKDWLRWYQKRVSRSIFEGYLMGRWVVPTPILDHVSPKYGWEARKWGDSCLRRALYHKDLNCRDLESCISKAVYQEANPSLKSARPGEVQVLGQTLTPTSAPTQLNCRYCKKIGHDIENCKSRARINGRVTNPRNPVPVTENYHRNHPPNPPSYPNEDGAAQWQ